MPRPESSRIQIRRRRIPLPNYSLSFANAIVYAQSKPMDHFPVPPHARAIVWSHPKPGPLLELRGQLLESEVAETCNPIRVKGHCNPILFFHHCLFFCPSLLSSPIPNCSCHLFFTPAFLSAQVGVRHCGCVWVVVQGSIFVVFGTLRELEIWASQMSPQLSRVLRWSSFFCLDCF